MKCPKCKGTGKVSKNITVGYAKEVDCEYCEGTGELLDEPPYEEILSRLDRIIELLERPAG